MPSRPPIALRSAHAACARRIVAQALPGLLAVLGAVSSAMAAEPDAPAVTVRDAAGAVVLANGLLAATVDKRSGDLTSLTWRGRELLATASGGGHGYWSHTPARSPRIVHAVTIDPASTGGARGEVSVKGFCDGKPLGAGPGGGVIADIEIRYALERGASGLSTYAVFTHGPGHPATAIGEARFAVKLDPGLFDFMTIDARRRRLMPRPEDWLAGTQLNLKEARRLTTGRYAGEVEHKYDYSAMQFDTPAFGWSSTQHDIGLWFINPSSEYLSGGPTKVELTGHLDGGNDAAPTLLNYWRGSHYGGSVCVLGEGEAWSKVVGPFLLYVNADPGGEPALWADALAKAAAEAAAWPYPWVAGVDYPGAAQRATLSGRLVLDDPGASTGLGALLVGLSAPDYQATDGKGGEETVDWQRDAKHYQFWVRGDAQGRFTIPKVRAGTYTLHAIADGVHGGYARTGIRLAEGQALDLGRLDWTPVRHGRQLWEIGIPDRSAAEFRHGDSYWRWGLYHEYPKDFPEDVRFVIGRSDWRTDWNYAQPPRIEGDRVTPTTWTIAFALPEAPRGRATLRLGICGSRGRGIEVGVNGRPVGGTGPLPDSGVMHRDGIRGRWVGRDVAFPASLLAAGDNAITLHLPARSWPEGVLYDYLRLELDETAPAGNVP